MITLKVEMHMHTFRSLDGLITPREVRHAVGSGKVDLVSITDHDTAKAWDDFKGLPIIKGLEKTVVEEDGNKFHLLIYFLGEDIRYGSFGQVVDAAREQDAFIAIAHPFDRGRKAPRGLDAYAGSVDALECLNSRIRRKEFNRMASEYAEAHGLVKIAGSDAHHHSEIGTSYMECDASTVEEFRKKLARGKAIMRGTTSPLMLVRVYSLLRQAGLLKPKI